MSTGYRDRKPYLNYKAFRPLSLTLVTSYGLVFPSRARVVLIKLRFADSTRRIERIKKIGSEGWTINILLF
jgi:hypothetical protein